MAGATMAQFFALSLYMQQVMDLSPLVTGFALAPQAVISFMFFPVSAILINKLGLRIALPLGLIIMAVGFALLGRISADGSYWADVLPSLTVLAIGGPLSFTSITTAAVGESADEAGLASGVVDAAQQVGTAIGLALFITGGTWFAATEITRGTEAAAAQANGLATAFLAGAVLLAVTAVFSFVAMGRTSLKAATMGPPE
jgi:fucose permease